MVNNKTHGALSKSGGAAAPPFLPPMVLSTKFKTKAQSVQGA